MLSEQYTLRFYLAIVARCLEVLLEGIGGAEAIDSATAAARRRQRAVALRTEVESLHATSAMPPAAAAGRDVRRPAEHARGERAGEASAPEESVDAQLKRLQAHGGAGAAAGVALAYFQIRLPELLREPPPPRRVRVRVRVPRRGDTEMCAESAGSAGKASGKKKRRQGGD